jgi:hypothetical protein
VQIKGCLHKSLIFNFAHHDVSGGPRILIKGMPHQNFGMPIGNYFVLQYREEILNEYETR